jgi:hypothetical protein
MDDDSMDILERIPHGPKGDIVNLYTTLPWHLLCEEVAKLKISLRKGDCPAEGPLGIELRLQIPEKAKNQVGLISRLPLKLPLWLARVP